MVVCYNHFFRTLAAIPHGGIAGIQPDEAGGVVLVVGLCRIGFHRGDVRVVEAHVRFVSGKISNVKQ